MAHQLCLHAAEQCLGFPFLLDSLQKGEGALYLQNGLLWWWLRISRNGYRGGQLEGDDMFSRDLQVLVAGESRSRGASACADQTAN